MGGPENCSTTDRRFLPRLLDVGQVRHRYDANRSGPNVDRRITQRLLDLMARMG